MIADHLRRLWPSFLCLLLLACSASRASIELEGPFWLELPEPQQLNLAEDEYIIWYFFSFRCPACYQQQAFLQQWQQQHPRQPWQWIPVSLTHHQALSRTWLAAWQQEKDMQALASLLYAAIHDQQMNLTRLEDIAPLVAQIGWSEEDFLTAAAKPEIDLMLADLERSTKWLGVTQVPSLVINGRWQLVPEAWKDPKVLSQALAELPAR